MKKPLVSPFDTYRNTLPAAQAEALDAFFADYDAHCLLQKSEKRTLRQDFEQAFLYYAKAGTTPDEARERLSIRKLGGFYARPAHLWFALDDAAKIYPLSMKRGRMSVFRLSVYLKAPVVPALLQMALHFTIKRFPSFATTVKKGFFWHYLDASKRRYAIEKESSIPCRPIPVARSGSQSFRILYYENRISAEFFHVLTDGSGGMAFLKTLTAEYLRLTGVEIPPDGTIMDINEVPDPSEFENVFLQVPKAGTASGFADRAAVQMTGRLSKAAPCRVLHFKMNAAQLKEAAETYNCTITAYLLALMFLAGKAAADALEGEASIQVPVNMRKFYPTATVRNFSMYCGIRLPVAHIKDLPSIAGEITAQLRQKGSKESMRKMVTATAKTVEMLQFVPLCVKEPIAKLAYGFLGDKIFTNTLSNLGVVTMPPTAAAHIESMDFVLGTAITNRAGCAAVTFNDITTFSVTKMTADPTFEETFFALLNADGVEAKVEGSVVCER